MVRTEAEALLYQNVPLMEKSSGQNTKIVATVGPACRKREQLLALIEAGVDVFRLNFSHGTHEDHLEVIRHIEAINQEYHLHIGILADLQGPKLRVGKIENDAIEIKEGDIITLVNEDVVGTREKIYMSYEQFAEDCDEGERILMDDGKLVFEVVSTNKRDTVQLRCLHGGILSSNKGVNLPDTNIKLPALTEKDLRDLDFILSQPSVNWIALSFVRSREEVDDLRRRIEARRHGAKVMAKIEKPEAVRNIRSIVKAANGIMIARGDLAIEMPMERLPIMQKEIIQLCMQFSRPVIVATQMMDSMIKNPSPTRAEITDVANAVLDGADAVMLSGETAVGAHPTLVVRAMTRIIEEAERHYWPHIESKRPKAVTNASTFQNDVICFNACRVAEEIGAKGIVGLTVSGYSAFKMSSYRPKARIYIFSDQHHILRTLNLLWGVQCFYYNRDSSTDETIQDCNEILKNAGIVSANDILINTASMPLHKRARTNMLKVTVVD
ncbi:MAG: pyruvate kinase [Saprospiraceae bacterium]|nr:pyruvate kinase [Saprospiraceae bacterium]MDW8229913.1 pyruvate kinase [Saprospiraceae bacterium]